MNTNMMRRFFMGTMFVLGNLAMSERLLGAGSESSARYRVYVGTYTSKGSEGIYLLELDTASGALTDKGLAGKAKDPSFLALHPSRKYLYAVGEGAAAGDRQTGGVHAFAVDGRTGQLTHLNQQPSGGAGPCHVSIDTAGRHVLVANYGSGSVAVLPIDPDSGELQQPSAVVQHHGKGTDPARQEGPHAHSINLDAANRFAFAADLGLDQVLVYRFGADDGSLVPNDPPAARVAPGSGPRHFAFHPGGRHAYVINEMLCTVTAFGYDAARGALEEIQTISTLPDGVKPGYSTAEVVVHPSGRFLYGSNRGHHSIAMFAIDSQSGELTSRGHHSTEGKTPRNFNVDPTGKFLLAANQDSDSVVVFRIDQETGRLAPTGHAVHVPTPVCVKFVKM